MSLTTYAVILIIVLLVFSGIFVVKQQTSAIIERFGRFTSIRQSGLHFRIPIIDRIAGRISLRILQLDVIVETKTKDDGDADKFCTCSAFIILQRIHHIQDHR